MTVATASADMFRPPVNRAMRVLDRSFFKKVIPTSAARINDRKEVSKCRSALTHDILKLNRMQAVRSLQDPQGTEAKALLLRPEIKSGGELWIVVHLDSSELIMLTDSSTWSPIISELVKSSQITVVPYNLEIDYEYWNYHDIISSILPESLEDELPSSFSVVGHIAHLNLREQYLPFKDMIAEIILDKNPTIRTVTNKIDEVGEQSEYRTFTFEILAGDPDTNVEVHESDCAFRFDYSRVYWNTRLETEHRRLVNKFQPGEAICDVMAGVGPFAVPAGKKQCFVWANDLNPCSYASLQDVVSPFVKPFNQDGRAFIRTAAKDLMDSETYADITPKQSRTQKKARSKSKSPVYLKSPKTFSHYILNLPATALNFLPEFIGLYAGHSNLFDSDNNRKLPMVHVHCFSTKSDDNKEEAKKICREISQHLDFEMRPGNPEVEREVEIWDVRDVAPLKRMFCASFRLPREVAFREGKGGS